MKKIIPIKFLALHNGIEPPTYATKGSAGFDIVIHNFKEMYSGGFNHPLTPYRGYDVSDEGGVYLPPHSRILIGSGFALEIPDGYQVEIRSRSGKALKEGLIVLNSPGTIDSDYRGEIGAIICNTSELGIVIKKGDKIAQGVVTRDISALFEIVEELSKTDRDAGGFGSTDKKKE